MTKKEQEIVKAIYNATGGTYIPDNCSRTLLGYVARYDKYGRNINPDRNICSGTINIDGVIYNVSTDSGVSYVHILNKEQCINISLDIEPNYLKEETDNTDFKDGFITHVVYVGDKDDVITEDFQKASIEFATKQKQSIKCWKVRYSKRFDIVDILTVFFVENDYSYNKRTGKIDETDFSTYVYAKYFPENSISIVGNYADSSLVAKGTYAVVDNNTENYTMQFSVDTCEI